MKFRKKPIIVDAEQIKSAPGKHGPQVPDWQRVENEYGIDAIGNNVGDRFECLGFNIKTLEGTMFARPGDWIIRGIKGELYPCRPDIFAATYEPAEEA